MVENEGHRVEPHSFNGRINFFNENEVPFPNWPLPRPRIVYSLLRNSNEIAVGVKIGSI